MVPMDRLKKLLHLDDALLPIVERLSKELEEKTYENGDVIMEEGKAGDALYLIAEGTVRAVISLDANREQTKVVARLEKEEFFGELSFTAGIPASATIVADGPVTVYRWNREALSKLLKEDGRLAADYLLGILASVGSKLRRVTRELVTVIEVAQFMAQDGTLPEKIKLVLRQLESSLGGEVSVAFYRWNVFNDDYDLMSALSPTPVISFPVTIEKKDPFIRGGSEGIFFDPLSEEGTGGMKACSFVNYRNSREGLLIAVKAGGAFDSGQKQLIETIAAVIAPSLEAARHREEEEARMLFERNRRGSISI